MTGCADRNGGKVSLPACCYCEEVMRERERVVGEIERGGRESGQERGGVRETERRKREWGGETKGQCTTGRVW